MTNENDPICKLIGTNPKQLWNSIYSLACSSCLNLAILIVIDSNLHVMTTQSSEVRLLDFNTLLCLIKLIRYGFMVSTHRWSRVSLLRAAKAKILCTQRYFLCCTSATIVYCTLITIVLHLLIKPRVVQLSCHHFDQKQTRQGIEAEQHLLQQKKKIVE